MPARRGSAGLAAAIPFIARFAPRDQIDEKKFFADCSFYTCDRNALAKYGRFLSSPFFFFFSYPLRHESLGIILRSIPEIDQSTGFIGLNSSRYQDYRRVLICLYIQSLIFTKFLLTVPALVTVNLAHSSVVNEPDEKKGTLK